MDQPRQLTDGGLATTIGRGERAWGAGLVRRFYGAISVAPSPQRPPKSLTLAGAASFGHGTEMRLGSGQAAAVWRSTGAIMGNVVCDFLLFSCIALFVTGIVVAAASLLI